MSLFCPPAGFPPHLALIWPLIWAQILVARAWVRATYGKGTLYRMRVAPWGQVFITSIDWIPGSEEPAPTLATLAIKSHARIASLTDGSMAEPAYAEDSIRRPRGDLCAASGPLMTHLCPVYGPLPET